MYPPTAYFYQCPTSLYRKCEEKTYGLYLHKRFALGTEYWKSQSRKYCEFCKCWFADNKVSISFHENGKRHKENVQKHISTLTKKSSKDAKQKEKIDDDMKKMESAAMAAYLKDVQNNADIDITSQCINEMLGQSSGDKNIKNESISTAKSKTTSVAKPPPTWKEVIKDDGSSYFWNTETNETTWEPPDEYVSVAQQEEQKVRENKAKKQKEKLKKEKQKDALKEAKAYVAREKMKELSVKEEPKSTASYGPAPRATKPYGTWTAVINKHEDKIDLQLPKPEKEVPPPPVVMEPEKIRFGEKRVTSLGDGPVEFKKRKFSGRRNVRTKLEDE